MREVKGRWLDSLCRYTFLARDCASAQRKWKSPHRRYKSSLNNIIPQTPLRILATSCGPGPGVLGPYSAPALL